MRISRVPTQVGDDLRIQISEASAPGCLDAGWERRRRLIISVDAADPRYIA
jgi:hypothetical protein